MNKRSTWAQTKAAVPKLPQISTYLALGGLLAVGLWLRLRFLQSVYLYPDEFVTLLAVEMIGQKGLPLMPSGLFYEHGLLFSYVGYAATLFGPADLAVRSVSLVAGMLTLGLAFFVGQRYFSPGAGLLAAAGLAVAPTAIEWSGRARMYALLQLLVLLTLWLAYVGLTEHKARWRWAAQLTYLGALLTHFVAVALAPPLLLAAAMRLVPSGSAVLLQKLKRLPQADKKIWLEVGAFLLILVVAFLVKRAGRPKGIESLEADSSLPGILQVFLVYSDFSTFDLAAGWQAIAPFYLTLPALLFLPFALLAGIGEWANHRIFAYSPIRLFAYPLTPFPLFFAFILLTTTLEMILFVSPVRRDDKYLFMLLPALLLLGAEGFTRLAAGISAWVSKGIVHHSPLVTLLATGSILAATWPATSARLANTGDDYKAAFAYVGEHWQEGDTVLTGTPAAAFFYLGRNDFYAVQRQGGYDYRVLTVDGQTVDRWLASPAIRTEASLHETLAGHNVWLVLERWGLQREYYDLPFQQQLLAQSDYVAETQGIFILRSKPNPRPLSLEPAHPVAANFAGQAQLLGYTLEPAGQPPRLTLYWQALAPMAHDYTVFVHLRRPAGGSVLQADHRPLGSLYPTTLWPPGESIRESSDLALPGDLPSGAYELWAGLYLLETGERLPIQNDTSGENAVKLGSLRVEPH